MFSDCIAGINSVTDSYVTCLSRERDRERKREADRPMFLKGARREILWFYTTKTLGFSLFAFLFWTISSSTLTLGEGLLLLKIDLELWSFGT